MYEFRLPNITAATERGQLQEIKTFLFQLTNQLNHAQNATETALKNIDEITYENQESLSQPATQEAEAKNTFNQIKNLIIKSADIIDAYTTVIQQKMSGEYVAQSDFGTYKEHVDATYTTTEKMQESYYDRTQTVELLNGKTELRDEHAYIRTGYLYDKPDGSGVYGVEVGQIDEQNDKIYARFSPEKLSFYDDGNIEIAYFANNKMYIHRAEIEDELIIGDYELDASNGLAYNWVGDE